jgi:hypothetical protein
MNNAQNVSLQWLNKVVALALCWVALLNTTAAHADTRGIDVQAAPAASTPFVSGTYRALIIGNDAYRDPQNRWPALKTAVSDARTLAGQLRDNYGFSDVTVLENASLRDMLLALEKLVQRVMANDSVLVYYAGHGYLDAQTERGYWVPVDAVGTDSTTFLRNSTIRDELSTIAQRAKHTLLISDSCFAGSLLRTASRGVDPDLGSERYYQKVSNKKSVQIITAGGVEYVDDNYRNSGHSPFTYFLLNELQHNNSTYLTARELSQNVEKAVANNVAQVPESGVLHESGDELGEFIFLKLDIRVQVEGVPQDKIKVQVHVEPVPTKAPEYQAEPTTRDAIVSDRAALPLPMF